MAKLYTIKIKEEKESIEGPIREHEAQNFLKNMKNDKSPGADGFTAGFLKLFWPDLKYFDLALKSSWIGRLIFSNSKWTNLFKANFGHTMQTLMKFGIDFTNMIMKNVNNRFWKDVFQCWRIIIDVQKGNCDRLFNEHIGYNPDIKIDNKSVFFMDLFNLGYIYI